MFRSIIKSRLSPLIPKAIRNYATEVASLNNVNIEAGIPGLYTAKGLEEAWIKPQTYLINHLKTMDNYKDMELEEVLKFAYSSSTDPNVDNTKIAHFAGQIYANEYSMLSMKSKSILSDAEIAEITNSLKKKVDPADALSNTTKISVADESIPNDPLQYILDASEIERADKLNTYADSSESASPYTAFATEFIKSFESSISFQTLLLTQAEATFSSGYTWLVYNQKLHKMFVMNTYDGGIPATMFSDNERHQVKPLLNVSVWQHAYIHDYGVAGKRKYLENWWNCIDWSVVLNRYTNLAKPTEFRDPSSTFYR